MRKVTFLFLILCSIVNAAQNDAPKPAILEGVVVNAANGSPIPDVEVTAQGSTTTDDNETPVRWGRHSTTDAQGRFHLSDVPPGRYSLSVAKIGFVRPGSQGSQQLSKLSMTTGIVAAGQQIKNIRIQLVETSVISGRIVDESGNPKSSVLVQAMDTQYRAGQRKLVSSSRADKTNEDGRYRLVDIEPGEHYLRALPASGVPAFYPGVPFHEDAAPIVLTPGAELSGIDFHLAGGELHSVRIKVRSATPLPDNPEPSSCRVFSWHESRMGSDVPARNTAPRMTRVEIALRRGPSADSPTRSAARPAPLPPGLDVLS